MRNLFSMIAFVFFGLALVGCYDNHGYVPPVMTMGDAGPATGDAGWPMMVTPDSGPGTPDSGPVVLADAGSDAYVPPMDDAGSDAGPPPEPDAGFEPDAGSDAGTPDAGPPPGPCDAVDVPADGSGHIVIRVEGGGDMTVMQDTDFVAFSVTIENHTLGPVEGFASFHGSTLSADCTVRPPSYSFHNECDATNIFHPTAGSCGAGSCGSTCAERGPIFASGTSTRFTAYGHTHAAGRFQSDVNSFGFRDAAGVLLPAALIDGLEMTPAIATITVPEILIEAGLMPPSRILVADTGAWDTVASYEVVSDGIESVFVMIDGFAEDTSQVAIAHYDAALGTEVIIGRTFLPSGENSGSTIILDAPLEMGEAFEIWVMIPPVVSNAVSGGDHDHFPMSGDTFRMGVNGVTVAGTFSVIPPLYGNEFVIRRSRPTIVRQSLSTTTIANGTDQDLYKFQVSADSAGSISLRRIGMDMTVNSVAGRVCNLRLRRGSSVLPSSEYSIGGPMFWGAERCWTAGSLPLVITFNGEQTLTGSGNVYTVIGTPEGFVAGDSITTSFNRSDDRIYTGYLFVTWSSTSTDLALDLSPYGAPYSTREIHSAAFIWSDLSEIPHSPEVGTSGGSRDWTNGYLLEDLTQTQTLTR